MNLSNRTLASFVVGSLALGGGLGVALASDPAQDRHMAMEGVNDAAKPRFAIAKKAAPVDAAVVRSSPPGTPIGFPAACRSQQDRSRSR